MHTGTVCQAMRAVETVERRKESRGAERHGSQTDHRGDQRVSGTGPAVHRDARPARVAPEALVLAAAGAGAAPDGRRLAPRNADPGESRLPGGHEADDRPL